MNSAESSIFFNASDSREIEVQVEGEIPNDLVGTIYRVGPGLFSRGSEKKNNFIEGDGLVHSLTFGLDKKIRLKQRFVETEEFLLESKENRFLFRTINSKAKPFYRNFGAQLKNLCNVNLLNINNQLLAFDEMQKPYKMDPDSLATLGESKWSQKVMAHYRYCPIAKKNYALSARFFPFTSVQVGEIIDADHVHFFESIRLPSTAYIHDWFLTENFYVFVIPPVRFKSVATVKMLFGLGTHQNCLRFEPLEKTKIVAVLRSDTSKRYEIETEPFWFWHGLHAEDKKTKIKIHLISSPFGLDPGSSAPEPKCQLIKFSWNLKRNDLEKESVYSTRLIDFPCFSNRALLKKNFWMLSSDSDQSFNMLAYYNEEMTLIKEYRIEGETLMSPVLAETSGRSYLLVEAYNQYKKESSLYILNADDEMNMQAKIKFSEPIPFSLHGIWQNE